VVTSPASDVSALSGVVAKSRQTICEDYRAAASIDLVHDEQDLSKKVHCPLLVLWGAKGFAHRTYDVLGVWCKYAEHVAGKALDCGHFLPEEAGEAVCEELSRFFGVN
jgi:haloacetate dehalogenase